MKIEIGKQYLIYPYNKWMVTEEDLMVGSEGKEFIVRVNWKGGSFIVTPENEEERERLQHAIDTDDEENELVSNSFQTFEIYQTTDGHDEIDFYQDSFTDEEVEKIHEAYNDDWMTGLSELGYDPEDNYFTLWGKVVAEEYVEV